MDFDQLMAKAARIAKAQDAAIADKAEQKRREEDERKRNEVRKQQGMKQAQEARAQRFEELERQQDRSLSQKRQQREAGRVSRQEPKAKSSSKRQIKSPAITMPSANSEIKKSTTQHYSFEELMAKAKDITPQRNALLAQSQTETKISSAQTGKTHGQDTERSKHHPTSAKQRHSSLVPKARNESSRNITRTLHSSPIQRSGMSLLRRSVTSGGHRTSGVSSTASRSRPSHSDNEIPIQRPNRHRSLEQQSHLSSSRSHPPSDRRHPPKVDNPQRRMPFVRQKPSRSYRNRYEDEEEDDEDLRSFVVSDEEVEDVDHSAEIAQMFRYDRRKYSHHDYSDDDMEADVSEVLREEKRSAQLGRKEDLIEEQLEMERLRRKKIKRKS